MAKRKSLFGLPFEMPFGFFAERIVQESGFRKDLKLIGDLEADKFDALSRALAEYPHFLDVEKVSEIVAEKTGNPSLSLSAVIVQLSNLIRNASERPEAAFNTLCREIANRPDGLGNVDGLNVRLQRLLLEPRGFGRQRSAEDLAEATGEELHSVQVICDIRPVFGESETEAQGAVLVVILRLEKTDLSGSHSSLDLRLSEDQLDSLAKLSETAKGRIASLKLLLDEKSIPRARTNGAARKSQ
jgi:hypothetical protein